MTPVFLLSLPRSGSTLVQRVLATHPEIATTSETWLLLPNFYALRSQGISAEYEQVRLSEAFEDFIEAMPGKRSDYTGAIREFSINLYQRAAHGASHFIDKTPRYHLILDELLETFPDAKFILLWRNPLAIVASMIDTWGGGRWNLHWFDIDLYTGLDNLVSAYRSYQNRIHAVRFEDFVVSPRKYTSSIFEYLGLPFEEKAISEFQNVTLDGRMGDPTGINQFNSINSDSLNKWKAAFCNPFRKKWGLNYLKRTGPETLNIMGYDYWSLTDELSSIKPSARYLISDIARTTYGRASRQRIRNCWGYDK